MNEKNVLELQAEVIVELFGGSGSLHLSEFLDAVLSHYEGKTDLRDFTPEEKAEAMRNAVRFMNILPPPEEDD